MRIVEVLKYAYNHGNEIIHHNNMWQSQVEIKHFSVAYFKCITMLKVLYHRPSV